MSYTLTLELGAGKELKELVEADGLQYGERSRASLREEGGKLFVDIEAGDATSLRATINGVLKVLQVYEKSGKI